MTKKRNIALVLQFSTSWPPGRARAMAQTQTLVLDPPSRPSSSPPGDSTVRGTFTKLNGVVVDHPTLVRPL